MFRIKFIKQKVAIDGQRFREKILPQIKFIFYEKMILGRGFLEEDFPVLSFPCNSNSMKIRKLTSINRPFARWRYVATSIRMLCQIESVFE